MPDWDQHTARTAGMSDADRDIMNRVLSALGSNRIPGYHFPGHFLGVAWERVDPGTARLVLRGGAHCTDAHGRVELAALAVLADTALSTAIRTRLEPGCRLATVTLSLQFTGTVPDGDLAAEGRCRGFFISNGDLALADTLIRAREGAVCHGSAAFMKTPRLPGSSWRRCRGNVQRGISVRQLRPGT